MNFQKSGVRLKTPGTARKARNKELALEHLLANHIDE